MENARFLPPADALKEWKERKGYKYYYIILSISILYLHFKSNAGFFPIGLQGDDQLLLFDLLEGNIVYCNFCTDNWGTFACEFFVSAIMVILFNYFENDKKWDTLEECLDTISKKLVFAPFDEDDWEDFDGAFGSDNEDDLFDDDNSNSLFIYYLFNSFPSFLLSLIINVNTYYRVKAKICEEDIQII